MKPEIQQPVDNSTQMSSPEVSRPDATSSDLSGGPNPGSASDVTLDGGAESNFGTMMGTGDVPVPGLLSPPRLSRTDADMGLEYQPGETFGRYQLVRKIAAGGMGIVYEARDQELHRSVALKMILLGRNSHPEIIERFYREARSAAKLDHPNIVPIYEIGAVGGQHYFTMAMIAGRSLQSEIEKGGPVKPARAAVLMASIAEAVGYAHQHHIIHRDLKPDNILLDLSGRPRVTDFGLAKSLQEDSNLTQTGQVMGTPRYMSPEQARAGEACIGPSTDIYALGGILVFLLTGKPPFDGTSLTEVLCKVMADNPLLPRDFDESISPEMHEICRRCLAKKPEDRYATCEELAAALLGAGSSPTSVGFPTLSSEGDLRAPLPSPSLLGLNDTIIPSTGDVVEIPEPKSKSPLNVALVGVAGLVILVVGILAFQPGKSPDPVTKQGENPSIAKANPTEPALPGFDLAKVPVSPAAAPVTDVKLGLRVFPTPEVRDGVSLFHSGDSLHIEVTPEKDVYLGIWTTDHEGVIVQLFPNEDEPDNLVRAGQTRTVPSEKVANPYRIALDPSKGIEQLRIMASTTPWKELKATREGAFLTYRDKESRENFNIGNRGAVNKRLTPDAKTGEKTQVTESWFNYYVKPVGK